MFINLRPEVLKFAQMMELLLRDRENAEGDIGWKDTGASFLLSAVLRNATGLAEEVCDFVDYHGDSGNLGDIRGNDKLVPSDRINLVKHAIDAANYAMMIVDNFGPTVAELAKDLEQDIGSEGIVPQLKNTDFAARQRTLVLVKHVRQQLAIIDILIARVVGLDNKFLPSKQNWWPIVERTLPLLAEYEDDVPSVYKEKEKEPGPEVEVPVEDKFTVEFIEQTTAPTPTPTYVPPFHIEEVPPMCPGTDGSKGQTLYKVVDYRGKEYVVEGGRETTLFESHGNASRIANLLHDLYATLNAIMQGRTV